MIAIIGALEIEVAALKEHMSDIEEHSIADVSLTTGKIGNKDVVLVLSGVGKVNAAMTTATILHEYDIEYVINIGTAGGFKEEQKVLDIVIADKVVQHDFDTSVADGAEGIGLYSSCDEALIKKAYRLLEDEESNVYIGTIASGDVFIGRDDQIQLIKHNFKDVIACEMEAGAISYVCNRRQVPCIVLRSLSDNATKEGSEMDFYTYAQKASVRSAAFCVKFINE
ncbi:5'-methylthioadenosine/adenosylhomocysteine nucleosidase [Breznakia pachnodae]|uniref:adenosylhomocysteine nucleosidase n=1 Tax=Breznakia pachnodae TaxID=265178 RepID=A0ABU0E4C9_9FIRM|nr:5'-methylthioadenosine/adenosylhomocysteine nucleosidase [Breznakia pachnodae]MDQ0361665.1 adenosylhomocysteine nucleosidase [Breznakia pachnodae]